MAKKIQVRCQGATTRTLEQLSSTQERKVYAKMKDSLKEHGLLCPFLVYVGKENLWVVDGNMRLATLNELKKEGFEIPNIPISFCFMKDPELCIPEDAPSEPDLKPAKPKKSPSKSK